MGCVALSVTPLFMVRVSLQCCERALLKAKTGCLIQPVFFPTLIQLTLLGGLQAHFEGHARIGVIRCHNTALHITHAVSDNRKAKP